MATSTASYGTYNPREDQPYNIESVLAKIVGENNPAEAANMLDTYQVQRQTAQGNYDYAMQGQHQFAKDQLAQQLHEANMKAAAELKDPTVFQVMANAPEFSGAFGGALQTDAGRAAVSDALRRAQAGAEAKNFEAGGKGYESYSNAGVTIPTNALPGLPPGTPATQTENVRLAQERLRANATLGAAGIRASADKPSKTTMTAQLPADANGVIHGISTSNIKPGQEDAVAQAHMAAGQKILDRRAGNTGAGPGVGGGSGSSLTPAKTDTPANRPGGNTQLDTNSPNGKMAQGGATIKVDRDSQSNDPIARQRAADIKAGMKSATAYDTHMNANGKMMVRGKSGNYYPIDN